MAAIDQQGRTLVETPRAYGQVQVDELPIIPQWIPGNRPHIKVDQTIAHLASTFGGHPTQLNQWKTQALKGLVSIFARKDTTAEL